MRTAAALKLLWVGPCTALAVLPALLLCAAGASARCVSGVFEVGFDDPQHPVARAGARALDA